MMGAFAAGRVGEGKMAAVRTVSIMPTAGPPESIPQPSRQRGAVTNGNWHHAESPHLRQAETGAATRPPQPPALTPLPGRRYDEGVSRDPNKINYHNALRSRRA